MEVIVFTSSISILVNGSVTKEFQVDKGLLQVDHLSLFLFIRAMEAPTHSMKKAFVFNEFFGFRVNDEVSFDILQFVDDTIIFSDFNWSNLWIIKAILRGFKLVSGLRINLCKKQFLKLMSTITSSNVLLPFSTAALASSLQSFGGANWVKPYKIRNMDGFD